MNRELIVKIAGEAGQGIAIRGIIEIESTHILEILKQNNRDTLRNKTGNVLGALSQFTPNK